MLIDNMRKTFLKSKEDYHIAQQPQWKKLRKMLLNEGGNFVVMNYEEDIKKIITRGEYLDGKVKIKEGRASQCHSNSAQLWNMNKDKFRIVTGYCLDIEDEKSPNEGFSCWRSHSWLIDEKGGIIETTTKRDKYFGFILSPEESLQFWNDNF